MISTNIIIVVDGDWIYEKDEKSNKVLSMKLSDDAYSRHFGIVNGLHNFLNSRGFNVSQKTAKSLEFFMEDLYGSFAYLVGACLDKNMAEDVIKWMAGPLRELMNEREITNPTKFKFNAPDFGGLVQVVVNKRITPTMGKDVLKLMADGHSLSSILEMDQFKVTSNDELLTIVKKVMSENTQQVEKAKQDVKLVGWIVGQVMKASGGKANAAIAKELIEKELL